MGLKLERGSPFCWVVAVLSIIVGLALGLAGYFGNTDLAKLILGKHEVHQVHVATGDGHFLDLPKILLEKGVYQNDSFVNEYGVIPAYWEGRGKTFVRDGRKTHGPCYATDHFVDWQAEIELYKRTQEPQYNDERIVPSTSMSLEGYCRPGFIIIGAGKCGTSSLYHYITSHPRVLPASEKQIHYFKYHVHEPLKWYYQHFPKTESFMAAGALMSGEASPGYLPYPDVVIDMKRSMAQPRLLAVGRNPIERAFSSYKYNYVTPTIQYLKTGKHEGIKKRLPDGYYTQFLFTFEEMMQAELSVLRECFAPGSEAEIGTRKQWGQVSWIKQEYKRRKADGLPPLLDLDGFCYGSKISDTVLRKQWTDLVAAQPQKVILDRNLHLTQAFIGRSLYLFPLEWWYVAFRPEHIYFVCTEELQDFSGESMNDVGRFLGLPRFDNFSAVVQGGAFNVGGHRGYDNEISWTEIQDEHKKDDVPLSEQLRQELDDFIRPYNERLFNMTGRRCNW